MLYKLTKITLLRPVYDILPANDKIDNLFCKGAGANQFSILQKKKLEKTRTGRVKYLDAQVSRISQ